LRPAAFHRISFLPAMEWVNYLFPTSKATGALRSFRPPSHFTYRPNSNKRFAARPSAPLPRLRRRKVLQFRFTLLAVHSPLCLGPIPKTTASLTYFQLHAQFHQGFSVKTPFFRLWSIAFVSWRSSENQAKRLRLLPS
jgi:hypothetical protein